MWFQQIAEWFKSLSPDVVGKGIRIAAYLVGGFLLVRLLVVAVQRFIMKKATPQRRMVARKIIVYAGFVIVLMTVLAELGVKLTALLGAAGIVGIAVGFASQTSVSNIISGLFLISEKPFAVGDVIRIGTTTGIIQSIDLLSIKLRTFDNLFVRIPNEKILTSEVTNITRFPIRRMDIMVQVSYREDLDRVREVLADIARANRYCLDEPAPVILCTEFKESGVELLFGLWFSKADFINLKNSIMRDIRKRFVAEGIEIPFPTRTLRFAEPEQGPKALKAAGGARATNGRGGRRVTKNA
ncbi:MAG: mechanosensitive ion channel family protein, partial [Spirochaetes bacterium]|nr:mechanosensitive ion channel family protein [Spirochaetota bacterium]